MIIAIGNLSLLFALAVPLVFSVILIILKAKPLYILVSDLLLWLVAVTALNNIFPLYIGDAVIGFTNDGRLLGFIAKPFDSFPLGIEFFYFLFKIYYPAITFGLLSGFMITICYKNCRSLKFSLIAGIILLFVTEFSCILPNLILCGANKTWDLSSPILFITFYIIGFFLAKALIKLNPKIITLFDKEKKVKLPKEKYQIKRRSFTKEDNA